MLTRSLSRILRVSPVATRHKKHGLVVMLNDLLYVLAGSYEQALHFSKSLNVHRSRLVYVSRPEHLRGIRNEKLYVTGTYYDKADWLKCVELAEAQDFIIDYV